MGRLSAPQSSELRSTDCSVSVSTETEALVSGVIAMPRDCEGPSALKSQLSSSEPSELLHVPLRAGESLLSPRP